MTARACRSVLYVDDDPDICVVVQTSLSLVAGMDVHTACSGAMAIDIAYEKRPDLIVLDVMMPGLDGPATYKRIRESPLIADTPIIFMTAKVMPSEVAYFLGLGAIGVVGKPFDPLRIGGELQTLWNNDCTTREVADRVGAQGAVLTRVDALLDGFLKRTRADVDRLRYLVKHARSDSRTELEDIAGIAHSIRGAAGMFGFPAVSSLADSLEHLAESLLVGTAPGTASADRTARSQAPQHRAPQRRAPQRLHHLIEQLSDALATAPRHSTNVFSHLQAKDNSR